MKDIPLELLFAATALMGGIARNLSAYSNGVPFNLGVFLASSVASGFSGMMFGLIGLSMNLPLPIMFIMAGTGGFFGDQTMKLVFDWIGNRIK